MVCIWEWNRLYVRVIIKNVMNSIVVSEEKKNIKHDGEYSIQVSVRQLVEFILLVEYV